MIMSKLFRDLQSLKFEFETSVNKFFSLYKDKTGKKVSIKSDLEKIDELYKVYFNITGIPRSRSRKEQRQKINVFIDGFIAGPRVRDICGYGTRISYVDIQANNFEYLEGFHFDYRESFNTPIQGGHPIFHAQLDKKAASEYVDRKLVGNIQIDEHPYALKQIRVPSAQMDAFSCVLMVIADHLYDTDVKDEFRCLVESVHEIIPNVDLAQHDNTTRRMFPEKTIASGWYFASF